MTAKNFTPLNNIPNLKAKSPHSVSPFFREAEPIGRKPLETQQTIENQEIESNKEQTPLIQTIPDKVEIALDKELIRAGVKTTNDTEIFPYIGINLPISDDKVIQGQHAPITSSLRWLALLASYVLWKAHIVLKVVHGKVVRVLRR